MFKPSIHSARSNAPATPPQRLGNCGRLLKAVSLAALLSAALPITAARAGVASLSNLFVFGDSLSDSGNAGLLTGGFFTPAPYVGNRASNGPVAVEYLWQIFNPGNNSFKPSLSIGGAGTNYSILGATTGKKNNLEVGNVPGSPLNALFTNKGNASQLSQFTTVNPSFDAETSLFMLWLFPNDVFYCLNTYNATNGTCSSAGSSEGADPITTNLNGVPGIAVSNLIASINTLADSGARNFLVVNSPDLGSTPAFRGTSNQTLMTLLSDGFNTALENQLNTLATAKPQLDIELFQLDDALNSLIADPIGSGFTNVTQPCVTSTSQCSDPSRYLFWDSLHPTTRTHEILAQQLYGVARDPVPAPMPFLGGLAALGWSRRLRQRLRQNRQGQEVQQTTAGRD
jgi:phospholipase/lecithinase/hemolysin